MFMENYSEKPIIGFIFGFVLIISGLFFKLGLVPFHYWIADVYEGSPLIVTYIFSVLPKISILLVLIKLFWLLLNPMVTMDSDISNIFILITILVSCLSIFVGA